MSCLLCLRDDLLLIGNGSKITCCVTFCGESGDRCILFPHKFFRPLNFITENEFLEVPEVYSNTITSNQMTSNGLYVFIQSIQIKEVFDGKLISEKASLQEASCKHSCDK